MGSLHSLPHLSPGRDHGSSDVAEVPHRKGISTLGSDMWFFLHPKSLRSFPPTPTETVQVSELGKTEHKCLEITFGYGDLAKHQTSPSLQVLGH